jgi:hypothetical protein
MCVVGVGIFLFIYVTTAGVLVNRLLLLVV